MKIVAPATSLLVACCLLVGCGENAPVEDKSSPTVANANPVPAGSSKPAVKTKAQTVGINGNLGAAFGTKLH